MALPFTWAQTIYARTLRQPLINEIKLSSILLDRLMTNKELKGGSGIEFPVEYAYNYNIGTVVPYESNNFVTPKGATKGYEDFVTYEQMIGYSRIEHARNMGTAPNQKAINDLTFQVNQAKSTLRHYLAASIYGDGTAFVVDESTGRTIDPFPGLLHMLSASNTVHGIAQGTYDWFQVGRSDSGSATWGTFTDSGTDATYVQVLLESAVGDATVGGERPNLIMTTQAIQSAIAQTMIEGGQRFVNVGGSEDRVNAGFRALEWAGIPVVADDECPDGYIFVLNTDHLYLAGNKNLWFTMPEFLPDPNGDAYLSKILVDTCLICDSPRHQAIIDTCPTARP